MAKIEIFFDQMYLINGFDLIFLNFKLPFMCIGQNKQQLFNIDNHFKTENCNFHLLFVTHVGQTMEQC